MTDSHSNQSVINELNLVMNYFALTDSCQSTNNHTIEFGMSAMPKFHRIIEMKLETKEAKELFDTLTEIFLTQLKERRKI